MAQTSCTTISAVEICDTLGRKAMANRLRRSVAAVSNAAASGVFPSAWFLVIQEMCSTAGIFCPRELFAFITPEVAT